MSAGAGAVNADLRADLRGDILATLMPGFSGFAVPDWLREAFDAGLVSSCVYGENVESTEQLSALGAELRQARGDAILAIDEEGGEVTRLHYAVGSPYPGAAVLGRIDDLDYTAGAGERVGRDILAAGFDLALAPVADANSNPLNPVIGTRSFAADPRLAARHVAAWVRGLQSTGAIACAKHFPGHGDTAQDSHLALPVVEVPLETLEQRELVPFKAAVAAGVGAVMTSHILLPQVDRTNPATFSRRVLQGLLREELGFAGVIVTDALDMQGASADIGIPEAAVRALQAGCDLLCLGTSTGEELLGEIVAHVAAAVDDGRLEEERVRDAARRVRGMRGSAAELPAAPPAAPDADLTAGLTVSLTAGLTAGLTVERELARVMESFDGVETARAWLAEHPRAGAIVVESEANLAVGRSSWGPLAAVAHPLPGTEAIAAAFSERRPLVVPNGATGVGGSAAADGVIVIGRELHRASRGTALLDGLRAAGIPLLVVEMGWPSGEPGDADVSTFGSSRLVGAALLLLLQGEAA